MVEGAAMGAPGADACRRAQGRLRAAPPDPRTWGSRGGPRASPRRPAAPCAPQHGDTSRWTHRITLVSRTRREPSALHPGAAPLTRLVPLQLLVAEAPAAPTVAS